MKKESTTISMSDEYGKYASVQRQWANAVALLISSHKATFANLCSSSPKLTILDLGCADGENAIPVLTQLLEAVRPCNPTCKFEIHLDDTLDESVKRAVDRVKGGLSAYTGVEVSGVAKSFYAPVFEAEGVDVAYSVASTHWLSHVPAKHPLCMYVSAEGYRDPVWEDAAQKDIMTFLESRAKELRKGGRLLISTVGLHDKPTEQEEISIQFYKGFRGAIEDALKVTGLEKHIDAVGTFPIYVGHESRMKEIYSKSPWFDLVSFEMIVIDYVPGLTFKTQADGNMEICKGYTKGWTYGFLKSGLECAGVPGEKVQEFLSNLYDVQVPKCYRTLSGQGSGVHTKISAYVLHLVRK